MEINLLFIYSDKGGLNRKREREIIPLIKYKKSHDFAVFFRDDVKKD